MSQPPSSTRRSARAHHAVLDVALELFRERGYARLTVDSIAAAAGVSKATIYRWWPNKAAILIEAFLTSVEPRIAFPDSGSLREDLVAQASSLARVLRDPHLGALVVALLGEAHHDDDLARAFRDDWQTPRRIAGTEVIDRAKARGELREDADPELLLDGVYGPLYLRLLFGHASLDEQALDQLVGQVLHGVNRPDPPHTDRDATS